MYFPQAWAICKSVPKNKHNPDCSYQQELLCDCEVLLTHPDYIKDYGNRVNWKTCGYWKNNIWILKKEISNGRNTMERNVMMYGICPPKQPEDEYIRSLDQQENKRAWSDAKDHIIISIDGHELGMDLIVAIKLYKQLGEAIKTAL